MRRGRQRRLGRQHVLALAGEARDLPHDVVLLRLVAGFPLAGALRDLGRVERGWHAHDHVGGEELAAVVGLDRDAVLDLGAA